MRAYESKNFFREAICGAIKTWIMSEGKKYAHGVDVMILIRQSHFFPFRSKYERISRQIFSHKSAYEFLISLCPLWSWETSRNSMKNERQACQVSLQNGNSKEWQNDRIQFVNNCSLVRFDLDPSSSINSLTEQHLLKNYVISNSFIYHARAGKK